MLIHWVFVLMGFMLGCDQKSPKPLPLSEAFNPEPAQDAVPVRKNKGVIENATLYPIDREPIARGYIAWEDGFITAIGEGDYKGDPKDRVVIDGKGMFVTPGLIDTHSHMGVYPVPASSGNDDGNEAVRNTTPEVWAEHSFWPQDPELWRAVAGGITTIQVLPGSANLVGGRSFVAKLRPESSARAMRFPGAPQGMKMACGENPKRVYGKKGGPKTRMGNVAGYRALFQKGLEYKRQWEVYERDSKDYRARRAKASGDSALRGLGDPPKPPAKDFGLDTIAKVLDGQILVHNHCYRADEMAIMLDLAKEYGFKIRSFHHALEAYKIAPRLAEEGVSVSTWADWWGFKMEAYDGIPYNLALLDRAGVRAIVHSDSGEDIRFLNQEAAKGLASGVALGFAETPTAALKWITLNPAWALGIDHAVGSLTEGKMADIVVWDHEPLSELAKTELVIIDGDKVFDRKREEFRLSDFELGLADPGKLRDGRDLKFVSLPDVVHYEPKDSVIVGDVGSVLIHNVRIDSYGTSSTEPRDVLVDQGLIKDVAPKIGPVAGVTEVDGKGGILAPGFVDLGTRLGLIEVEEEDATHDDSPGKGDRLAAGFEAYQGFNPFTVRIPIIRAEGVTTALSGAKAELLSGFGFAIQLTGDQSAVNLPHAALMGLIEGGKPSRGSLWEELSSLTSEALLWLKHSKKIEEGELRPLTHKKTKLEGFARALLGETPLVMQVRRASDMLSLIRWRDAMQAKDKRFTIRMIFSGANESWLIADELARAGVGVVLTPSDQTPESFDALHVRDDVAGYLVSRGVPVAFSNEDLKVGRLRQQAMHAMRYGLPRAAALAAITVWPARFIGLNDRGLIAPGQRADLVLWSKDPLSLASAAQKVWINGVERDLTTRQLLLARRYQR